MGLLDFFDSGRKYETPVSLSGISSVLFRKHLNDTKLSLEWCKPGREEKTKRGIKKRFPEVVFNDAKPLPDPNYPPLKRTPYLLVFTLYRYGYRPPKWWEVRRWSEYRYPKDIIDWLKWCRKYNEYPDVAKPFPQLGSNQRKDAKR
ncbi:Hypothetical protein BROD_2889 [Brucella sp. NF 2653]|uniref:hypothetical protein n=1 Tax=unclassified Brucella TaxID=2632610 RepID=UPI0001B47C0A|nr:MULTISPECIES: hypothetical protein [unclassified Brucella]EFM61189.1 Hypothetical protein BROD_2889 [Brucella sp. NF 2653]